MIEVFHVSQNQGTGVLREWRVCAGTAALCPSEQRKEIGREVVHHSFSPFGRVSSCKSPSRCEGMAGTSGSSTGTRKGQTRLDLPRQRSKELNFCGKRELTIGHLTHSELQKLLNVS